MKKIAILLALFSNIALAYKNEPNGFRDINWGDNIKQYEQEFTYKEKLNNDSNVYVKNTEKKQIGGAELSQIYYEFYKDQFYSVMITTEGYDNNVALLEAFKAQFGEPRKPNRYMDAYLWIGKTTQIFLKCTRMNRECTALMNSTVLEKEKNQDIKNKANEAQGDF